MAYDEKLRNVIPTHNVTLDSRKRLTVTGASDVESFDENEIVIKTSSGVMTVDGTDLHMEKLSIETGDVAITGLIYGISYEDTREGKKGFFGKLFA